MKPEFSETTYGFALVNEIVTGAFGPLRGVPVFPSLNAEGGADGLGYDVRVQGSGFLTFLQFKTTHYMKTAGAAEWDLFDDPYYRMQLYPPAESDQHRLLMQLERAGEEVYYVGPVFHTAQQLNDYFNNQSVHDHSAYFSPLKISKFAAGDRHRLVFAPQENFAYICSDPRRIEAPRGGETVTGEWVQKAVDTSTEFTEVIIRVAARIRNVLAGHDFEAGEPVEGRDAELLLFEDPIEAANYVAVTARVHFGAEPIFMRSTP